jgi:hypothetical protein
MPSATSRRQVPSGDIISSARLCEDLPLAVKDPNGKKHMTMEQFYNDHTCVEEIHDGFVAMYASSVPMIGRRCRDGRRVE